MITDSVLNQMDVDELRNYVHHLQNYIYIMQKRSRLLVSIAEHYNSLVLLKTDEVISSEESTRRFIRMSEVEKRMDEKYGPKPVNDISYCEVSNGS